MKLQFSLFMVAVFGWGCNQHKIQKSNPVSLRNRGKWVSADTVAMEPSLRNFRGQAVITATLPLSAGLRPRHTAYVRPKNLQWPLFQEKLGGIIHDGLIKNKDSEQTWAAVIMPTSSIIREL